MKTSLKCKKWMTTTIMVLVLIRKILTKLTIEALYNNQEDRKLKWFITLKEMNKEVKWGTNIISNANSLPMILKKCERLWLEGDNKASYCEALQKWILSWNNHRWIAWTPSTVDWCRLSTTARVEMVVAAIIRKPQQIIKCSISNRPAISSRQWRATVVIPAHALAHKWRATHPLN